MHVLDDANAAELDVLFLAVDGPQSREIMAGPGASVPLVVDNSSAFRLADDVPLVVPEANAHAARERHGNLIANPNCTTAAVVVALAPIRDLAGLESVDLASYQAVSGAGRKGVDAFEAERGTDHRDRADGSPFHGRIADSVVPQIDVLDDAGWTGEEKKIHAEIRKILEMPELDVAATTVRVAGSHRPLGGAPPPNGARHVRRGAGGGAARRAGPRVPPGRRIRAPSDAARRRGPRPGARGTAARHPRPRARLRAVGEQRQPAQGRGAQRDPVRGRRRSRALRPAPPTPALSDAPQLQADR